MCVQLLPSTIRKNNRHSSKTPMIRFSALRSHASQKQCIRHARGCTVAAPWSGSTIITFSTSGRSPVTAASFGPAPSFDWLSRPSADRSAGSRRYSARSCSNGWDGASSSPMSGERCSATPTRSSRWGRSSWARSRGGPRHGRSGSRSASPTSCQRPSCKPSSSQRFTSASPFISFAARTKSSRTS